MGESENFFARYLKNVPVLIRYYNVLLRPVSPMNFIFIVFCLIFIEGRKSYSADKKMLACILIFTDLFFF